MGWALTAGKQHAGGLTGAFPEGWIRQIRQSICKATIPSYEACAMPFVSIFKLYPIVALIFARRPV